VSDSKQPLTAAVVAKTKDAQAGTWRAIERHEFLWNSYTRASFARLVRQRSASCDQGRVKVGSRRKYVFTDQIDQFIREIYLNHRDAKTRPGVRLLAKKVGMPHWALKKRARELGLARTKELLWSEPELAILSRYAWMAALRRAMYLAYKWKLINRVPSFTMLGGERKRTFVVTPAIHQAYLETAPEPLKTIEVFGMEDGLRLEEMVSLSWSQVYMEHEADADGLYG